MGGGKQEIYTSLQASTIFDPGDNLYAKELVRLFAVYKTINPALYTRDMIESSRKYFSPELFEALGVGVKNTAAVTTITLRGVYTYMAELISQDNLILFYYSAADNNEEQIKFDAYKIEDRLSQDYNISTNFSRTFIETFEMRIQRHAGNQCTDIFGYEVYEDLFGNTDPDSIDFSVTTYAYEINPGEWYSVKDGTITINSSTEEWEVIMIELDSNWVETGNEIKVTIPEDFRSLNIARGAWTFDDCDYNPTWTAEDPFIYYKADVIGEDSEYRFFIFPVKDNFAFVETPEYQDVLLNDLGLGNGVLEDSLSDPGIFLALITYSVSMHYNPFAPYFKEIYGTNGNRNNVVFNTPHYNITYTSIYGSDNYQINVDGSFFNAMNDGMAMVPVDILDEFTMPERYGFMRDMFRIWGIAVQVVELKWYQTGFFKFVAFILTAAVAIFTQQYWILGASVGIKIGMKIFGDIIPPELMAIVAIAVSVYTLDFNSLTSGFATVANLTNSVSQVYFMQEQDKILEQIESSNEMAKAEAKALKEMQKDTLYVPMDSYSSYFTTMYDTLYNSYDGMYDSIFNFDRMLKPNAGVIHG